MNGNEEIKRRAISLWLDAMDANGSSEELGRILSAEIGRPDGQQVICIAFMYFAVVTWPAAQTLMDRHGLRMETLVSAMESELANTAGDYLRRDVTAEEASKWLSN